MSLTSKDKVATDRLPTRDSVAGAFYTRARCLVLPLMVAAFSLYVAFHSPLRDVIAASLGLKSRACYFLCADALIFSDVADALSAWALILAAVLAAWIVCDRFDGASYERPVVFGLSALAFISVPGAMIGGLASWSSTALLRPPLGPLLTMAPAVSVLLAGALQGWRPSLRSPTYGQHSSIVLLVWVLAASLLSISAVLSVVHPPTGYDALGFHAPLGIFLWQDGNLDAFLDRAVGYWPLAHPGAANLWFGLLQIAGGESLSNLGQLPFALLASSAVNAFTRRLGLGRGAGLLSAAAFLLMPVVVIQSGMQLTDVAGAAFLMITTALCSAPIASWTKSRLALVGLGLGLAVTTKLSLIPGVVGVGVFVLGAVLWRLRKRNTIRPSPGICIVIISLAFFAVTAPWWIRNIVHYGNPVYPASLPFIGRGISESDFGGKDEVFVPHRVAWIIYPLIEKYDPESGFGALFAVGAVIGFAFALIRRSRNEPLLLYILLVAASLPGWWMFTRHQPRFLLSIFGLGFAFLPWSLLALPRYQRRVGGTVILSTAFFSMLVTFYQALLPFALQPHSRNEFYDRIWGVDPFVISLPENEGLLQNTGYAAYTYPGHYPLLGPSLKRVVVPIDTVDSVDPIITRMQTAGLRYAYVTASPESRVTVESIYDKSHFELVHTSTASHGWVAGTRRYLYRLKEIEPVVSTPGKSSNR